MFQQLELIPSGFGLVSPPLEEKEIFLPPIIKDVMDQGAALAISVSGGKDSDAMLHACVNLYRRMGWTGPIFAIFADLGRIEWPGALRHIQKQCNLLNINLEVVKRPQGGMVDRWRQRLESIAASSVLDGDGDRIGDKPHWSSASSRYCTDHLKTQQIDKHLRKIGDKPHWSSASSRYCTKELKTSQVDRNLRSHQLVVCAVGIRAQESPNRAKNPRYSVRSIATKALLEPPGTKLATDREAWADASLQTWLDSGCRGRLALTWHPIFHWPLHRVWTELGTSPEEIERRIILFRAGNYHDAIAGFPGHWVYVSGNTRMSCSMCVLASGGDIRNGAILNPLTWLELALMELESGWSFKMDLWLASLEELVVNFPLENRRKLLLALYQLDLISQWPQRFSISMLTMLSPSITLFWSEAFLEYLAN